MAGKQKKLYEKISGARIHIWDILYPIIIYYIVIVLAMNLAQLLFGSDAGSYMACQILSSVIAIPVVYSFYKSDQKRYACQTLRECMQKPLYMGRHILFIVVIAALLGTSLNNLISMTPLVSLSDGFAEANQHFYGSTLFLELTGSALVTPVLEELLFRGIVYGRLRELTGRIAAILISSLIFGLIHFNLVQFVYAFLLGIALSLVMECAGHLYGAVALHMTANFLAVVRTETGILEHTADGSVGAWLLSAACLLAGVILLVIYVDKCIGRSAEM